MLLDILPLQLLNSLTTTLQSTIADHWEYSSLLPLTPVCQSHKCIYIPDGIVMEGSGRCMLAVRALSGLLFSLQACEGC
jgi:hypothetical protein